MQQTRERLRGLYSSRNGSGKEVRKNDSRHTAKTQYSNSIFNVVRPVRRYINNVAHGNHSLFAQERLAWTRAKVLFVIMVDLPAGLQEGGVQCREVRG